VLGEIVFKLGPNLIFNALLFAKVASAQKAISYGRCYSRLRDAAMCVHHIAGDERDVRANRPVGFEQMRST